MARLTIRNLDEALESRLRARAAAHGHSMEEEAYMILRCALGEPQEDINIADLAESLFGPNGVDLEPHPRVPVRDSVDVQK